MESSAVTLTSVLEGCAQAKLLSVSLGKGSHAETPKLLGNHHQVGTGGLKLEQVISCPGSHSPLLCAAVQGGKGFTGQHRPVLKVTFRAAPAQLAH